MTAELLVNIDVDDLARGIAFFTAAFDLTVRRRFGDEAVELTGAGASIFLLVKAAGTTPATGAVRAYARHWTPVHLDFVVDDIDDAAARVTAAGGVAESPIRTHGYGKLVQFADPFGNGLCLIQFLGRGYDEVADRP